MRVNKIYIKIVLGFTIISFLVSCESFVEVDVPNDRITGATVFNNNATALSALKGLYIQLFNTSFAAGGTRSVTFLSGLSSDNFNMLSTIQEMVEFSENEIFPSNTYNLELWSGAYATIYMANDLIEGAENSTTLDIDTQNRIVGEAKFIRAFTYFYLVNIYNKVPLILTTDYNVNATASSATSQEINDQVIIDLETALQMLDTEYPEGMRTYANTYVVMALLARVHLFQENWDLAEFYSNQVIAQSAVYALNDDPDQVFLPNSSEAIWQIQPAWGGGLVHTREGNMYIITLPTSSFVDLSENFMSLWQTNDLRFQHWIGNYSDGTDVYNFPFKYKVRYDGSGGSIPEYSMVMRLAEQYLIRAEARARLGNISGAVSDIDMIRERANISLISNTNPGVTENELLDLIFLERRKELFSEWGHRWLDLKRTNTVGEVLSNNNPLWESTDIFYPIPEQERFKNPNLNQNEGY